jgi:putative nucleotidyltransferase with HDIG domain
VVIGLAVYIARFQQPKMLSNIVRQSTTALVLLSLLALGRVAFVSSGTPHLAVGSQAFAAALLGIIYAHGSIFAITGALAVLMTVATQQGMGFCIVLLAVSGVLLFGLRTVRNRGKIVAVGAAAGLVALATTVAVGLINHQALTFVWKQGLWAAGTTLAAAFIVEGILPAIERAFRLSTSMTLLEWCDASKRLLRMMAADAPGTYNHSLLVGALGESAAEAVGANGLLARAGAYYHDIGKLNKPEYFVENQVAGVSRHDRLSPAMSHLVIIGHVKDGTEMAKEYGLPASLQPFIAEHHGTTVVEYFYHAASKARKPGDAEVSDTAFRYAGPKPQSCETAIVMLCDGVEGAVRAMTEPTPGRIENVVSQIIRKRLVDDQLDECDLTFRELATIERSLVKSLCSIYHARIVYPEKEEPGKPAESRAS